MLNRTVHIGTSGWSYDHWANVLYPPGLPARERLAHYAARFTTVELNASFYRWPRDTSFAGWRRRAPAASVRFPAVRQGSPWIDAREEALRPGGLDRADRPVLARTR